MALPLQIIVPLPCLWFDLSVLDLLEGGAESQERIAGARVQQVPGDSVNLSVGVMGQWLEVGHFTRLSWEMFARLEVFMAHPRPGEEEYDAVNTVGRCGPLGSIR